MEFDNKDFNKYWNEGGDLVNVSDLNKAQRRIALIGGAALLGTGVGMYWSTLQKLTDQAVRSRLLKSILNKTTKVTENYSQQDMPVDPSFITRKSAQVKTAAPIEIDLWDRRSGRTSSDIRHDAKRSESVLVAPGQGFKTALTSTMAANPTLYNTLGLIAIPAAFGLGVTASKLLTDRVLPDMPPSIPPQLARKLRKAEKRYEEAAKKLNKVSLNKKASVDLKNVAKIVSYVLPKGWRIVRGAGKTILAHPILSTAGTVGTLYGGHRFNSWLADGTVQPKKADDKVVLLPKDPDVSSTNLGPLVLGGLSLAGLGLGAASFYDDEA